MSGKKEWDLNGITNDFNQNTFQIDFQLSYWNRPEGDLFYFLTSSVVSEVLVDRFDYFLQFYHEKLIEAMKKLKVKGAGPSLKAFQMQLLKNSYHITKTLIGVLPVILMDKSDALSLEDLMDHDNTEKMASMENKMFSNPRFAHKMKLFLPFFFNRGMLDSTTTTSLDGNDINGNRI